MHPLIEIVGEALQAVSYVLLEILFFFVQLLIESMSQYLFSWLRLVAWVLAGAVVGAGVGLQSGSGLATIYNGPTWHNLFLIVPLLIGKAAILGAGCGLVVGLVDLIRVGLRQPCNDETKDPQVQQRKLAEKRRKLGARVRRKPSASAVRT